MIENDKSVDIFLEMEYNSPCNRLQKEEKCLSLNENIHPREGTEGKICFLRNLVTRAEGASESTWFDVTWMN